MSVTLEAWIGNNSYSLSGGDPYHYVTMTGVGLPPIQRLHERGPFQDGSTDRGFLLNERRLNLALLFDANTLAQADQYRDDLANILKPLSATPINLRVTRDDGKERQIDVYTLGIVDFPATLDARLGSSQRVIVQFEAAEPIWYDPALQAQVFQVEGEGGFQVAAEIPWQGGAGSEIDQTETIGYAGNWAESPSLLLQGPLQNAKITNLATGEVLDFDGTTISNGDTYTIDLRAKTIVDSSGDSQIDKLSDDSDLATWHLGASPEVADGNNDIRVEASSTDANSGVVLRWFRRHTHL